VKYVKDNGRLEVVPIGHWSARFAEGARCTIFTEKGSYRGTILPLKASGHTYHKEVDTQPVGWEHVELRIDALARSRREVEKLGIEIGDIVAIDPQPELLDNGFINSRHLDDKGGVAVMLAAIEAMCREKLETPVDIHWLFTIEEETGIGASSILSHDIAAMVAVDNGTTAPGQGSREFGVTDLHGRPGRAVRLAPDEEAGRAVPRHDIVYQKDVFRHYRSDSASAIEAGFDVRTALVTFGVDGSHGYERIHMHALRSVAELLTAYVSSPVKIARDAKELAGLRASPSSRPKRPSRTCRPTRATASESSSITSTPVRSSCAGRPMRSRNWKMRRGSPPRRPAITAGRSPMRRSAQGCAR
jgi:putative aminopeptidase FrvX